MELKRFKKILSYLKRFGSYYLLIFYDIIKYDNYLKISNKISKDIFSQIIFYHKDKKNRKVQFFFPLFLVLPNFFTFSSFSCRLHAMLCLDFYAFDNFLFLDLSLRCHEALINLFPHLHELNLAAVTHLKISKEHLCN